MSAGLYLREDAYVEPLVNHWYAWPSLIAPVQYAMYATKTHHRLMASFVANAEMHVMANQDRAMSGGGQFVDCRVEQREAVQMLLDRDYAIQRGLAEAVKQLDALLCGHRSGETLEPLYALVPELLRGYVELFMDLYHQPSYRLIEPLLYRSPYYDPSLQSMSFGLLSRVQSRPFVLSTPRLPDGDHLHVRKPFVEPRWDRIFSARSVAVDAGEIDGFFGEVEGGLAPRALFTAGAPSRRHEPVTEGVRLRYTGHAGFVIETRSTAILVDPVIANRTESNANDVVSYAELPPVIDYVCLTHSHSDHTNLETLLQLRHKIRTVAVPRNNGGTLADPSLKLLLRQLGFPVIEVDDLEELPLPDGRILSIPFLGEHGDLHVRSKTAWLFELEGKRIYTGADSANLEPRLYERIHALTGDLDVLAIGMECIGAPYTWLYGALATTAIDQRIKQSRRLNGSDFEKAAAMARALRPRHLLIYALGLEPWYRYFMGIDYTNNSEQILQSGKMLDYCREQGIHGERLFGTYALQL